jgi:hypothetical protein
LAWQAERAAETPRSGAAALFLAVLVDVRLRCLFRMASGMNGVAGRRVGVVGRLFVMPGIVMLGGFRMVTGGLREVLRRLLVVFCSLL